MRESTQTHGRLDLLQKSENLYTALTEANSNANESAALSLLLVGIKGRLEHLDVRPPIGRRERGRKKVKCLCETERELFRSISKGEYAAFRLCATNDR